VILYHVCVKKPDKKNPKRVAFATKSLKNGMGGQVARAPCYCTAASPSFRILEPIVASQEMDTICKEITPTLYHLSAQKVQQIFDMVRQGR
jgi:hypothetical protein